METKLFQLAMACMMGPWHDEGVYMLHGQTHAQNTHSSARSVLAVCMASMLAVVGKKWLAASLFIIELQGCINYSSN